MNSIGKKGTRKRAGLAVILMAVLAMALAACSTNNAVKTAVTTPPASETASEEKSSEAATPVDELPPVELNWYLPGTPQKDTEQMEQALNEYLKDKINATIKLNLVDWGSWSDKFPVLLASGDNVDIMFTAGWSQFAQSVARGFFTDLTELLPKYAPNTYANLPKPLLNGATVNGKLYALPTSKEIAHTYGFGYSVELAEKFGVAEDLQKFETQMPKLEDLEPILKKVKEQDSSISPLGGSVSQDYAAIFTDFDPVGDQNIPGKLYPNSDTKVINELETPEYLALLRTVHKYYKEGYVRQDAISVKDESPFKKGQKIFLISGVTKPLANEELGSSYGYQMKQFSVSKPFITSNDTQGSMNAVATTSKNPERALMFLELVNSDPFVNNTLNYGVENVHYVKKGDNVIDFAPGVDAQNTGYNPNAFWEFGNQFLNYFRVGQNTAKWEQFKAYNDSGVPSKILGFNFDAEPVKTEIAAVINVKNELWPSIATGTVDPDENLSKLIDKLKKAGLDKIIAEKQRQIDEWLAAQ